MRVAIPPRHGDRLVKPDGTSERWFQAWIDEMSRIAKAESLDQDDASNLAALALELSARQASSDALQDASLQDLDAMLGMALSALSASSARIVELEGKVASLEQMNANPGESGNSGRIALLESRMDQMEQLMGGAMNAS